MKSAALFVLFGILYTSFSFSQIPKGVVCRKEYPAGAEKQYRLAKFFVPNTTISGIEFDKMKIYVSYKRNSLYTFKKELGIPVTYDFEQSVAFYGESSRAKMKEYWNEYSKGFTQLYIHSNYQNSWADYPTKIIFDIAETGLDIDLYVKNLIYGSEDYISAESSLAYKHAIKYDIEFFVDVGIYQHSELKFLNLNGAKNVHLVNGTGVVSGGYDLVQKQLVLKDFGFYTTKVDGLDGPGTRRATQEFKEKFGLEEFEQINFRYKTKNGDHHIEFEYAEDFIKYYEQYIQKCKNPVTVCINDGYKASVSLSCEQASLSFSTDGNISLTTSYQGRSKTINLIESSKANEQVPIARIDSFYDSYEDMSKHTDNPIEFLELYEYSYPKQQSNCTESIEFCLGGSNEISYSATCNGKTLKISTSGSVSLTSENGDGRSVSFN